MIPYPPINGISKKSKSMPFSPDLQYWLALCKVPELGPCKIKLLFEHFKSGRRIWQSSPQELSEVEGISKAGCDYIVKYRDQIKLNENIDFGPDISVLTLEDPDYPSNLYNIYDPPPVLFIKGSILPKDSNSIAVVGTRKSTYYGGETTRKIIRDLADANITIISGLAQGIDSIAHRTALEYGMRTIAVFGCGLNTVYPSENKWLAQDIMNNGALVSEFEPQSQIEKWNFPRRNRIISGLSLGTLVIEGDIKSGALITARYALDQNRDVFAVPGSINNNLSKGPNSLIKQGAKLVETGMDVLEELHISYKQKDEYSASKCEANVGPDEAIILNSIANEPKYIDNIVLETNFSMQKTSALISSLLLAQNIKELPGKYFTIAK